MNTLVLMSAALALPAFAMADAAMSVRFGKDNALESIRVGAAEFATGGGDLWTAEFASAANLTNTVSVAAHDAASVSRQESDDALILVWKDIPLCGERGVLDAKATIAKRGDGSQAWSIEFDNRSSDWRLLRTGFPHLRRVTRHGEGDVMLPSEDYGARLDRKCPGFPEKRYTFHYLGYAPMVSAFFIGEDGLYFAAEDPEARIKSFVIGGEQNVCFDTPAEVGAEGPRHSVVLAPLKGDWWAAARRYRDFALGQRWAANGPIKDNPLYPRQICEIPLWINIHGYADAASNVLARAKQMFPDFPTGLHWHLWQHSGHDVNYPEYFPEQRGTKECLAFCRSIGQMAMPYTNGRLWTATSSGYIMAEPYAVMNADGTRNVERYGKVAPLAVMCPSCPQWHRVVRSFTGRVLDELGAESIFIDQIGAAPARPCYDATHGHPVGGGAWWREGYAKMMEPIHREWNAKGAFVTTEGAGEAYMDMVDGYLQVTERRPNDVPFWSAVYSGYTTYFCSPQHIDDDAASFRAQQTREMLWGHPLGWFPPDILDRQDKCEIIGRLCGFRQANLDALAYGSLLDELRPLSQLESVPFAWGSHFGRKRGKRTGAMPAVIGNWWRTPDGKTVLLAANLTDKPQKVAYAVFGTADAAEISLAPHELRRIE